MITSEPTPGPEAPQDRGAAGGGGLATALDIEKIPPTFTDLGVRG